MYLFIIMYYFFLTGWAAMPVPGPGIVGNITIGVAVTNLLFSIIFRKNKKFYSETVKRFDNLFTWISPIFLVVINYLSNGMYGKPFGVFVLFLLSILPISFHFFFQYKSDKRIDDLKSYKHKKKDLKKEKVLFSEELNMLVEKLRKQKLERSVYDIVERILSLYITTSTEQGSLEIDKIYELNRLISTDLVVLLENYFRLDSYGRDVSRKELIENLKTMKTFLQETVRERRREK